MAVLTLRNIARNPAFLGGQAAKISRRSVKATIGLTSLAARSDWALRGLFTFAARGLPLTRVVPRPPSFIEGMESRHQMDSGR